MAGLDAIDEALLLVRERWRERSLRTIWLRAGDWYQPEVDGAVSALLAGRGELDAVEALGVARGSHGIGVGEAIDDLACLYAVVDGAQPPLEAVRALCEGWASLGAQSFVAGTCMDPESGLPTAEYLTVRLKEEFSRVRREGGSPAQDLCFIFVDVAREGVAPWNRLARSAAVGRALEATFGEGYPVASLGSGVFAVLHRAGAPVGDAIARLSRQIDVQGEELGVADVLRKPPRLWIESMPGEHRDAVALLTTRRPSGAGASPLADALLPRSPFTPDGLPPYQAVGTIPPYRPEPLTPSPRPSPEGGPSPRTEGPPPTPFGEAIASPRLPDTEGIFEDPEDGPEPFDWLPGDPPPVP